MPTYKYEAKSFSGKVSRGILQGDNEVDVRHQLRGEKLIPIKVEIGRAVAGSSKNILKVRVGRARPKDLQILTRQLSVLISSGVPLVQALEVLSRSPLGKPIKMALERIVIDISEGRKLGESFKAHPNVFSSFYVNMLIAGEEGGILDKVLAQMAVHIEKSVKLRAKVKAAATYPIVVLFISISVITGLLVYVVPKFVGMFQSSGQVLPPMTQLVITMSEFVIQEWSTLLIIIFGLGLSFRIYINTSGGRTSFDRILLIVPVFGSFIIKTSMAKFSRTLSSLLSAGVPILDSLDIAANTSGNSLVEKAIVNAKEAVSKGEQISTSLARTPFIPQMVIQMMAVGEQTGALDDMLDKVAEFYENEVEAAVSAIVSLMEPVMIVFLGGIIAFFVIAMYLPIFNMAGTIG